MFEAWFTLIVTTGALFGSPGPAPLALAAVGATSGFRKGVPFLFGILTGLVVAILGTLFGLAALFSAVPEAKLICQIVASLYMVYVAYKIASANFVAGNIDEKIPDFKDGFVLNLFNPKAYAAFLAIFSQFLLPVESIELSYALTAISCFLIALIVDILWLAAGGMLKPVFNKPKQARMIRLIFAAVMLIAVGWALF
ncbi:LysE family translocator [Parashewanella spongiae]|uniref:LysE family translocator n=1 Tax=Parashewanella spongiae TaxID=342950 RepID=A0A3A6UKJ0_9GAMM|nr:LysE family translocator [Parashewanella spongiae]MCL1077717.1 LysE family translocator [Parashewanella spongiae]RJY18085.1 LysE family translocator [Parashewanella spongiae]